MSDNQRNLSGNVSDVAFTETVKAIQSRKGSRTAYARMEQGDGWQATITEDLKQQIELQISVFLATANAQGQPYIQHRGGPPGFMRAVDETTIAFADFAGNRQFITQGNLSENAQAHLFLIDYAHQRRIKIWGTARVVEGDAALMAQRMPQGYRARPEQVILFTVTAWDVNCPQHIPRRFEAADVKAELDKRERRIADLEAELSRFRSASGQGPHLNAEALT
jgi:predicted pyridoxine 5'-phosphate oxidase superfamily flavin-nucleotide-binding protein